MRTYVATKVIRTGKPGRPRHVVDRVPCGQKVRRKPPEERRPRECCAGVWGDPHKPGCLQYKAGRGNGKTGRITPDDRGRYNGESPRKSIQVCASMFPEEAAELDALAAKMKLNRSNLIRLAIKTLRDRTP